MLILLPLLRRLSVRSRILLGLTVTVAGTAMVAVAATIDPPLLVHGIITAVVGMVCLASAGMRRATTI